MTDRTVKVTLRADVKDFRSQIAQSSQSLEELAKTGDATGKVAETGLGRMAQSARLQRDAWDSVGTSILGIGVMGTAALGGMVSKASDFEFQMSAVQAATLASAGEMEALEDVALEAGARTSFSATEAAQGLEELAKAGVSTTDIINGGLDGALDLAAAGGISVAEAAEAAASAMTQFSLSGKDVPHVADLLAAAAGKAQGGVSEMSQALNQSGLIASSAGLSIEETVGTLGAFASAGLLGSDAGTSFKTMLQKLQNPSKESATLMSELGLSLYNASGEIVGMADLAGQLQSKLGGMTSAQRDATMAQLFGSDAVRAANVLYKEGAEGIDGWISAVDDAGYAQQQAAARMDNLAGSWEEFTGALETFAIEIGSKLLGPLKALVDFGTNLVNFFADLPDPVQLVALGLGAVASAGALAGGSFLLLAPRVADAVAAFHVLKDANLPFISKSISAMGIAVKGVGSAFQFMTGPVGISIGLLAAAAGAIALVSSGKSEHAKKIVEELADAYGDLGVASSEVVRSKLVDTLADDGWLQAIDAAGGSVNDFVDGIMKVPGAAERFKDSLSGMKEMTEYVTESGDTMILTQKGFMDLMDGYSELNDDAIEKARLKAEAMTSDAEATRDAAEGAGQYAGSLGELSEAEEEAAKAAEDLFKAIADSDAKFIDVVGGYDDVITKNREWAEETAAATSSSTDSWEDFYDGATVSMEDYLAELERQVAAQQDWEKNMLVLSGRVSQGVLDELARMGPEAAPLVADLVNASDEELARFEEVMGQRSAQATGVFADNLTSASPVFEEIMRVAGWDAANAAADEVAAGGKTLAEIVDEFDLSFVINAETGEAQRKVNDFIRLNSGLTVKIYADAVLRNSAGSAIGSGRGLVPTAPFATGGPVFGPGSETSDSILARLSRNEHVWSAREVRGAGGHSQVALLRSLARTGQLASSLAPGFRDGGSPGFAPASWSKPSYVAPMVSSQVVQVPVPVSVTVVDVDGKLIGTMGVVASEVAREWVRV